MQLHRKRRLTNFIVLALSFLAMAFGLFWLIWILWTVLEHGMSALSFSLLTLDTPAPGEVGGLRNAIVGSAIMVGLAMFIATPIAVLAGIYLSEFGQRSWLARVTRFMNDILLSAPSIVIGLFIYSVYVAQSGKFSALAGSLALALLVIPVVVRTTDDMLRLVPDNLREAAYALGAPQWKVTLQVTLRAARNGVITGILLALARISGETAPLLFTALSNQFYSTDITGPMANLPVTLFKFAMSPFEDWQALAWAGVFLITLAVLLLNILARLLFRNRVSTH